ncbi:DsbE family thiol:disulfide interchange protein [Frigidibacter mobilis]|uniref:Thiol-disulfide interchange protein n=1 Tax=Frigidibacter mobilis TaxID=1335048 RepID=A0A159Z3C9_9RHOB|nr:DsbE family thiol:disulfide interchange protein [Frigidibacter mobilis]AMY69541.1 thiol-disulfide interchange protein [Frigidibacter mobilis]
MAKISPLLLLPPLLFAGLAGMFIWGMNREDPTQLPTALAGRSAPPVVLEPLMGPVPTDATLRDGQVKLVNYWASWCAPCRVEHPNLAALAAEGVAIYGINYKDEPAKALAFLDELGNPYAALGADATGRMALDWGVYGVPETYVIDGEGTIILRFAGPVTQRVIEEQIRPALEKARAGG